jgi:chromosome segregation ATPase
MEDIDKRDATIRELESKLAAASQSTVADVSDAELRAKDEEIFQLRTANEQAQAWMAKAVEHHTALSEQVSALSEDKDSIARELQMLRASMSERREADTDTFEERLIQMETDLGERTAELDDAQSELNELREKLEYAEERTLVLEAEIAEIGDEKFSAVEEIKALRVDMKARDQDLREKNCRLGDRE